MKKNYSIFLAVALLLTFFNAAAQCPPQALPATVSGVPQYFICPGESVTLTASGLSTYSWSNGVMLPTIVVTPTASTSYTLTGYTFQNCPAVAYVDIQVNVGLATYYAYPFIPSVAGSSAVCQGQSASLLGYGAASYSWSTSQQASNITVSPTVATVYTLSASNGQGCISTITTTLTPVSGTFNVAAPPYVCQGSSATVSVSSPVQFPIYSIDAGMWGSTNFTSTVAIIPTADTTYAITNNFCNATETFSVDYIPIQLAVSPGTSTYLCTGNNITLTASGANSYTWTAIDGSNTIVVSPTVSTVYTVSASSAGNQCTQTQTVFVNVVSNPPPQFTVSSTNICYGQSITFDGWGSYGGWSIYDGVHFDYSFNNNLPFHVTYTPTVTTTYTLVAFPDDINPCPGGRAYVTVNFCVGIAEQAADHTNIAFPNPSSNAVQLQSSALINSITLSDVCGNLLIDKRCSGLNLKEELSIAHLNAGIYFVSVNKSDPIKILKE